MKHIKSDQVVVFDVDLTLFLWGHRDSEHYIGNLPYKPHTRHILSLMEAHAAGETVIVWSKRGHKWAKKAVELLGITPYVHLVMSKPSRYYDDKDANEWMYRVFKEE